MLPFDPKLGGEQMSREYWFYFDLYSKGRLVGKSNTFKIHDKMNRVDAKFEAEVAWLASGALRGQSFVLFKEVEKAAVDAYSLRDHEDSPTKSD
jgi:hypothetical protein